MNEQEEKETFKESLQGKTCSAVKTFQQAPFALSRKALDYTLCKAVEKFDGS